MPKVNVNSRDNFSSIYGIVDKYANTISQPVNADSDVEFRNLVLSETLTVNGNLTVNGATTIISADVIEFQDNIIEINAGEESAGVSANLSGIQVNRGTLPAYQIVFQESSDDFRIGQINSLQSVATREDNPLPNGLMVFDNDSRLLRSTSFIGIDTTFTGSPSISPLTGAIVTSGIGLTGDMFVDGRVYVDSNYLGSANGNFILSSDNDVRFQLPPSSAVTLPVGVALNFNDSSTLASSPDTLGLYINSDEQVYVSAQGLVLDSDTHLVFTQGSQIQAQDLSLFGSTFNVFARVLFGDFTNSVSGETGAVVVSGGLGVTGAQDAVSVTNGGALSVVGGAAIAKKLFVGGSVQMEKGLVVFEDAALRGKVNIGSPQSGVFSGTLGLRVDDFTFQDTVTPSLGVVAQVHANYFGSQTLSALNSGVTATTASTVFVKGPPIQGANAFITNAYSLNVDSGTSRFNGNILALGTLGVAGKTTTSELEVTGTCTVGLSTTVNTNPSVAGKFLNILPSNLNDAITTTTANEMIFNRISSGFLSSTTAITTTHAATLAIDGAPTQGLRQTIQNRYALWVKSGLTKLVALAATTLTTENATVSGNLSVTGATNFGTLDVQDVSINRLIIGAAFASKSSVLFETAGIEYVPAQNETHIFFSRFNAGSVTTPVARAAAVYIEGPPVVPAGDAYSLLVDSGVSKFSAVETQNATVNTTLSVSGTTQLLGSTVVDTDVSPFTISGANGVDCAVTGSLAFTGHKFTVSGTGSDPSVITAAGPLNVSGSLVAVSSSGKIQLNTSSTEGIRIGVANTGIPIFLGSNTSETTVGNNLIVSGNFAVRGETTTLNSNLITTSNNSIIVNSMPLGLSDGGLLVKRYQPPNDSAIGQVVQDINPESGTFSSGSVDNTLFLGLDAITVSEHYVGWWVKVTSGLGVGQVRRIKSYNGTTREASLYTTSDNSDVRSDGLDLAVQVSAGDGYSLYPGSFAGTFYNDTDDEWVMGRVPFEENAGTFPLVGYADLRVSGLKATHATVVDESNNPRAFSVASSRGDILYVNGSNDSVRVAYPGSTVGTGPNLEFQKLDQVVSRIQSVTASSSASNLTMSVQDLAGMSQYLTLSGLSQECVFSRKVVINEALQVSMDTLFDSTVDSTGTTNGSVRVRGGMGVEKNVYIGGLARITGTTASTSAVSGAFTVAGGVGIGGNLNVGGVSTFNDGKVKFEYLLDANYLQSLDAAELRVSAYGETTFWTSIGPSQTLVNQGTSCTSISSGALVVVGGTGISENLFVGGIVRVDNTTASTSVDSGSLVVSGGLGVGGDMYSERLFSETLSLGTASTVHALTLPAGSTQTIGLDGDNGRLVVSASAGSYLSLSGNNHISGGEVDIASGQNILFTIGGVVYGSFAAGDYRMNVHSVDVLLNAKVGGRLDVVGDAHLARIAAGLWNGDTIGIAYGGTGTTSFLPSSVLVKHPSLDQLTSFSGFTFQTDTLTTPKFVGTSTAAATSSLLAPNTFAGGLGIAKNLFVGTELRVTGNVGIGTDTNINSELTLDKFSNIGVNTLGGADDGALTISGGGSALASRGGFIALHGNQSPGNTGNLILAAGTGSVILETAAVSRLAVSSTGIVSLSSTAASTSSTVGSVLVAGSIAISNSANSTSVSSGGTLTTAGGASVAKDLYVGGDLVVTGNISSVTVANYTLDMSDDSFFGSTGLTVSSHRGKLVSVYTERTLSVILSVLPGAAGTFQFFEFDLPSATAATSLYDVTPSIQGFTANFKAIENIVCHPLIGGTSVRVSFTSYDLLEHTLQCHFKYT